MLMMKAVVTVVLRMFVTIATLSQESKGIELQVIWTDSLQNVMLQTLHFVIERETLQRKSVCRILSDPK